MTFANTCQHAIPPVTPLHLSHAVIIQKPFYVDFYLSYWRGGDFQKYIFEVFSSKFDYGEISVKTYPPIFLDPKKSNQT